MIIVKTKNAKLKNKCSDGRTRQFCATRTPKWSVKVTHLGLIYYELMDNVPTMTYDHYRVSMMLTGRDTVSHVIICNMLDARWGVGGQGTHPAGNEPETAGYLNEIKYTH